MPQSQSIRCEPVRVPAGESRCEQFERHAHERLDLVTRSVDRAICATFTAKADIAGTSETPPADCLTGNTANAALLLRAPQRPPV
jgi:hypothetical protein